LSKAHIPARPEKGTVTCYRGASLIQVRLHTEIKESAKSTTSTQRGEITEFSAASRRRMLELMAKIDQKAVPLFVTLTYPDNFPLYRAEYKPHLERFCDRLQRRWPKAAIIWKLEFQVRKSGQNKGNIAPHYHLFVYGVPWRFPFKKERGQSVEVSRSFAGRNCEHWKEDAKATEGMACIVNYVILEEPDGRELADGTVVGADSLKSWLSRNWFDVVGSDDIGHYHAGTRAEHLKTVKGAFAYAGKRYIAKKEEFPQMAQKPGRFWGVIGRQHLPLGRREDRELSANQAVKLRRVMRRYRVANTPPEKRKFLRKSQLWSEDFTAKLFCNVEFWLERLPKLIEPQPEFERPVSAGGGSWCLDLSQAIKLDCC
jgi:hypothetical protein